MKVLPLHRVKKHPGVHSIITNSSMLLKFVKTLTFNPMLTCTYLKQNEKLSSMMITLVARTLTFNHYPYGKVS